MSLPLLLWLLLGWLWRMCVWSRSLWLMNRLPLQLDAAHPDHTGGLRFVGVSLDGFLPLGFIVGVMAAGPWCDKWSISTQTNPLEFKSVAVGAAILVLVLCARPMLVFFGRLLRERHRGALQYGALAMRMGGRFRRKWLRPDLRLDQRALDVSDLTVTNAMYSIAANAQGLQVLPLELKSVGLLIVATCLPFVPVWLLAVPFDEIAKRLSRFLL